MMSRSDPSPSTGFSLSSDASQLGALALALGAACAAFLPWGLVTPTDTAMFCLGIGGFLGFVLSAAALRRTDLSGRVPWRVTLAWLALGVAATASTLFSQQGFTSLLGAPAVSTGLAQLAALSLLATGLSFSASSMRRVLVVTAPWIIGVQLLIAGVAWAAGRQPAGTLSNSTYLGQVVLLLLPLASGPRLSSSNQIVRYGAWGLGVASAGLLAAFGSYLAAVLVVAFLVAVAATAQPKVSAMGAKVVPALLAATIVLVALPVGAVAVFGADSPLGDSLSARPYLWQAAFDVIADDPLLGVGPNAYRVAASPVVADAVTTVEGGASRSFASLSGNSHNVLLDALVDVGVVGVLLGVWLLYEIGRNWHLQGTGDHTSRNWCAWGAVLYLGSGALAPLPLQTLMLAAVVLGASLRPEFPKAEGGASLPFSATRIQWMYGVLALVLTLSVVAYGTTRLWIGAASPGQPQASRAASASTMWGQDSFLRFWEARQWWLADAGPGAVASARSGTELEPENAFLWLDYAHFLALFEPDSGDVLAAFERAEELYPASLEIPLYRGRYLLEQGETAGARADAARAIELAPDDREANELMRDASF